MRPNTYVIIAESGEKHVVGLSQGATENTAVVKGLSENLVDRGLDLQHRYLVVIDGSKELRAGGRTISILDRWLKSADRSSDI
jgi:hypothetical protein